MYPRPNKGGTTSFIVDLGKNESGKRDRRFFKTKGEAETFAELARTKRENDGVAMFNLPREFWVMAQKASEILAPFKASILDAASYYVEHLGRYKAAPTVKEAIDQLLAEMQAGNRRDRTLRDVKNRLGHFANDFGTKRLSEISLEDIKRWTVNPTWGARTRINYLTKLSQFFNFGVRNRYVKENIVDLIKRPTPEQPKTEILTVEQSEQLLNHANDFGLLRYVAIGLFGGLRSAELMRLGIAALDFEEKVVIVGADIAKKRAMRDVTMNEALQAWLEVCPPLDSVNVVDAKSFAKNFKALRKAAGITKWPHNGMRHSFGSYHLAKFGNAETTAKQMGNTEGVVHKHYKILVRRSEAEKFWALRPKKPSAVATNVVELKSSLENPCDFLEMVQSPTRIENETAFEEAPVGISA